MSLQVSNQASAGRRAQQVYQGFGGNVPTGAPGSGGGVAGGGPASNGAGGNAAGNTSSRASKGGAGGKQSHIPVAIGSTGGAVEVASPSAPPTALLQPGNAGNNTPVADMSSLTFVAQKQQLLLQQQQQQQQIGQFVTLKPQEATAGRKATNGNNANGAGATQQPAMVDKNGASPKKAEVESNKASPANNSTTDGGKVRDSPRSSGRTQKTAEEAPKLSEQPKDKQQNDGKKTKATPVENSLVMEKTLKGFDSDGEEMESLVLDDWDLEDTSMAATQPSTKSKIPKPSPSVSAREVPNKSAGKQSEAKLEPVPEQKTKPVAPVAPAVPAAAPVEKPSPKASPKAAEAPGTPQQVPSESSIGRQRISGRRSTRPINEIKFTYHRQSGELNDSISSLNVTVGSDVYMDSMRTPGSATRKRKDMTPESTTEAVESPKRARLDFSGFLGMVATPVTMLKNRLSRVKLHASTPRSLAVEEEDASKVVTAEATTTTTGPAVADEAPKAAAEMEVDEKDVAATTEAKDDQKAGEGSAAAPAKEDDSTNPQPSASASADGEEEVEVKIVTDKPKQWCSVM